MQPVAVTDVPTETISVANARRLTRRLWGEWRVGWSAVMKDQTSRRSLRSAICTASRPEQGLEQDFNSLGAQRAACEAYPSMRFFPSPVRASILMDQGRRRDGVRLLVALADAIRATIFHGGRGGKTSSP